MKVRRVSDSNHNKVYPIQGEVPAKQTSSNINIADVASKVDLITLAWEYGLDLIPQNNGDYVCFCPFHDDKETPSMRFYAQTNTFHCPAPDSKVLMGDLRWKLAGNLSPGDEITGVDENVPKNARHRRIQKSIVKRVRKNATNCLKVVTDVGDTIVSEDHRFLCQTKSGVKWKNLKLKDKRYKLPQGIKGFFAPDIFEEDFNYKLGYFTGYHEGNGVFQYTPNNRRARIFDAPCKFELESKDIEGIQYISTFLDSLGIDTWLSKCPVLAGGAIQYTIFKINIRNAAKCAKIYELFQKVSIEQKNYRRGWLAGIFDARGVHAFQKDGKGGTLRVYNKNKSILNRIKDYLIEFNFNITTYKSHSSGNNVTKFVGVKGGIVQHTRFLAVFQPKIARKHLNTLINAGIRDFGKLVKIQEVIPIGVHDIVEIETSTKTLITDGLVSHNCFGCQAGASVFEFVMRMDNIDFSAALHKLAERVGYSEAYSIRDLDIRSIDDNFITVREDVEVRVYRKAKQVYDNLLHMGIAQSILYQNFEVLWKWYDRTQYLFDKKLFNGTSQTELIGILYRFYEEFLNKLTEIEDICLEA